MVRKSAARQESRISRRTARLPACASVAAHLGTALDRVGRSANNSANALRSIARQFAHSRLVPFALALTLPVLAQHGGQPAASQHAPAPHVSSPRPSAPAPVPQYNAPPYHTPQYQPAPRPAPAYPAPQFRGAPAPRYGNVPPGYAPRPPYPQQPYGPARNPYAPPAPGNSPYTTNQQHLGGWLQNHQGESFAGQTNALRQEKGFSNLPQQQQQRLIDRLHQLDSMPPAQRQRTLGRIENMEHLSPDRRQSVRNSAQELSAMDPTRKQQVRGAFRALRDMPPAERQQMLNSPEFRSQYSDHERQVLGNLLSVEPYNPQ